MTTKKTSQYREKISLMVSWGHWFTLFNIIISLMISSRYLFIINWPGTLLGRIYAIISWLGHFSFLAFASYLLIFFPLTFIISSQRFLRILAVIYTAILQTLLVIDIAIFQSFHLHLSSFIWTIMVNSSQNEYSRGWQWYFILGPILILVQILISTWCWQKLRQLQKCSFAKPIVLILTLSFIFSHLLYAWADANFYHSITVQKNNLPLAQPLTARTFLAKYGFLDKTTFKRKLEEEREEIAKNNIEYPLNKIRIADKTTKYNLLIIVLESLDPQTLLHHMPKLSLFAHNNLYFANHFSTGNNDSQSVFGLLYGISPIYMDDILSSRKPSALISTLNQENYQIGLFSSTGFNGELYRKALFSDFSLPSPVIQSNTSTTAQWLSWKQKTVTTIPWFSYIDYSNMTKSFSNQQYKNSISSIDKDINSILTELRKNNELDNTVVIITAKHNVLSSLTHNGDSKLRQEIHVPLIIHWPDMPKTVINKMTSHEDIMLTIMSEILGVQNPKADYSQGEDLFSANRIDNFLILGSKKNLIVITPKKIFHLNIDKQFNVNNMYTKYHLENSMQFPLLIKILNQISQFSTD